MLTTSFALYQSVNNLIDAYRSYKTVYDDRRPAALVQFFTALLAFMAELYLLVYMLNYVMRTTPAGPALNIRIFMLLTFTMPFTLLVSIFDANFARNLLMG